MFIKYEAEVSSRVGSGERGVVDFGKLFTENNEQKFSLELEDLQSSRKRFGLEHREGDLCWSRSESLNATCLHLRQYNNFSFEAKTTQYC